MQCSGGFFLLSGRNLTRSNFDHSENCYLVGGNEPLVGGEQTFGGGGGSLLGGIFPGGGGGMSRFLASWGGGGGGRLPPPIPPSSRENPVCINLAPFISKKNESVNGRAGEGHIQKATKKSYEIHKISTSTSRKKSLKNAMKVRVFLLPSLTI